MKKQDNLPYINTQRLSFLSDLTHLFTGLLLIREAPDTLSLWVCISAWLF